MRHPASTHPDFVKTQAANRIDAEADLLRKLMQLPRFSARRLVNSICSATYPQPTSCRTLAVWAVVEGLLGDKDPAKETTGLLLARLLLPPSGAGIMTAY